MHPDQKTKHLYEFGPFQIDIDRRVFLREGRIIALAPKLFDTLFLLVEHRGQLLEKDQLMNQLWPDTFVEESNLARNISQLRKILGEGTPNESYIETVPKRGYVFVAEVKESFVGQEAVSSAWPLSLEINDLERAIAATDWMGSDGNKTTIPLNTEEKPSSPLLRAEPNPLPRVVSQAFQRRKLGLSLLALIILVGTVVLGMTLQRRFKPTAPFQNVQLKRLTHTGRVDYAALSPDGKYIAYVSNDPTGRSLWVRQIATGSGVQLRPPSSVVYLGVNFSPDGNYLYYNIEEKRYAGAKLYQIATLGGEPREIMRGVSNGITFSPDGKQMGFIQFPYGERRTSLAIANSDGSSVRQIATRNLPDYFTLDCPSWSPDGKLIASGIGTLMKAPYARMVGINIADGTERLISLGSWTHINEVAWIKDGRGVIAIANPLTSKTRFPQIWYMPFPSGEARRITNDLNEYDHVSMTADGSALAAVQITKLARFWLVPEGKTELAVELASNGNDNPVYNYGMSWTPDGKIVYGSNASGLANIWVMNADGSGQKQLTTGADTDFFPVVSPDGRTIAFISDRLDNKFRIWLMDADGRNLKKLTDGQVPGSKLSFTPDGQWIIFDSWYSPEMGLWKVSVQGGPPIKIMDGEFLDTAVSPDGKWLAVGKYFNPQTGKYHMAIFPSAGGAPVKLFEPLRDKNFNWTTDSQAITYVKTVGKVSNIWRQPINGDPPQPLTNFKTLEIFTFAWSRDGRQLACERAMISRDIVLVKDLDKGD